MNLSLRILGASLLLFASSAAQAAWHEAKSRHFIIYADESPKALLDYATRLEKFDQAVRTILRMQDPPVGDGNRLTVFVLPTDAAVRELAGDKSGFLKGFYTGRASGSLAYVPKRIAGERGGLGSQNIFYHEYAHHLMMQQFDRPYPEWYVEGFAEFLSNPDFRKDGSVGLGSPAKHRAWGLFNGKALPLEALLGGTYGKITTEERESIYGRGWLLVHYLSMSGKRRGQLERYIEQIGRGTAPVDAARAAFGDLRQLDKELDAYLQQRTVKMVFVGAASAQPGAIEIKPLSAGASGIVLSRARLKNSDGSATNPALLSQVRAIQSRYPGDELVELTLAEAELNAGNIAAAEAAADRALKANPRSTEGLVLKGRAMVERASQAEGDASAAFAEARRVFIGANKIDPEDPEPLIEFYKSFLREGRRPTANAIAALHYASNLAPQDLGLRMNSAVAYLNEGKAKEARAILAPVAYSPHGGEMAVQARRMIGRIDAGNARDALRTLLPETVTVKSGS